MRKGIARAYRCWRKNCRLKPDVLFANAKRGSIKAKHALGGERGWRSRLQQDMRRQPFSVLKRPPWPIGERRALGGTRVALDDGGVACHRTL
jgi:hypothetical protein